MPDSPSTVLQNRESIVLNIRGEAMDFVLKLSEARTYSPNIVAERIILFVRQANEFLVEGPKSDPQTEGTTSSPARIQENAGQVVRLKTKWQVSPGAIEIIFGIASAIGILLAVVYLLMKRKGH